MDETLKAQIRQRMREKDTEDLLEIWKQDDDADWSDEAYQIVHDTLLERGVQPPEPVETDGAALAGDGENVYHDYNRSMQMAAWAAWLSWFFFVAAAVGLVAAVFSGFRIIGESLTTLALNTLTMQVVVDLVLAAVSALFFVLAQAVNQIIYLLLDIEDNTRPTVEHKG